jgi:hypothetical protein
LRNSSPPIVPRLGDAPTTATLVGSKNERSDATTAVWSRSSTLNSNRSVIAIGNCTSTTPPASSRVSSKPARSNTPSIDRFSESTSATKRSIPTDAARAASCSSSRVPIPRPCSSSATAKADSAERRIAQTDVVPDRDDPFSALVRESAQQRTALDPVRIQQRLDELWPQIREAVEATVQALARKRPVEVEQRLAVRGRRRPQAKRPAVAENHVDGVGGGGGHGLHCGNARPAGHPRRC